MVWEVPLTKWPIMCLLPRQALATETEKMSNAKSATGGRQPKIHVSLHMTSHAPPPKITYPNFNHEAPIEICTTNQQRNGRLRG